MRTQLSLIAFAMAFGLSLCFAQNAPERLAVYVSGASDAGVNKSLGGKLLLAMSQSGVYAEIADPAVFQDELAKSGKGDIASIAQAAKQHGAEIVCVVSVTEVLGAHSIIARLLKTSDSQVVKTSSVDRALKSLEDLTAVSNELARQLVPPKNKMLPPPPAFAPPVIFAAPPQDTVAPPAPVVVQNQCSKTYNINELLFKIKEGFPTQLKNCSSTLAKDMLNPFGKKLEPKSFMMQCPIDGIKKELPDGFPGTDKILGGLTNFVQGLLNSASAGSAIDPKKLVSAVASMDILGLLSDVKKLASAECVVDEPYEPPVAPTGKASNSDDGEKKDGGESAMSFGIRAGINLSHTYSEYNTFDRSGSGDYGDIFGMQLGFVVDFTVTNWFHIQPGLMYIQKGMEHYTAHYLELPVLLSFKPNALSINAGPYVGLCLSSDNEIFDAIDFGISAGIGFDAGMFYIGTFYNYGFVDVSNKSGRSFYNRTLGLNLGVNL